MRRVLHIVRNLLALFGALVLVQCATFDVSEMVSPSMSPTLRGDAEHGIAGDWVLTEKVSYWFRRPHRWELVRYQSTDGLWVMKRVAGLPGEAVSVRENQLVVDGASVARPASLSFLRYYPYGKFRGGAAVPCKNGYFVLGDDSKDSQDSRYEGPLEPSRIQGRPMLRVWPLSRVGWVNP
jgi:signal peptidase I